jgi:hypothetical protein
MIALSRSSRVAAVYTSGANRVQVITGLPEQFSVQRSLETGGARIHAIAVSDSGRFLVAAFDTGSENSTLLRLHDAQTGSWKDLGPASRVTSIAFSPNDIDVAVAADFPAVVSLIRDIGGAAEWRRLTTETEGLTGVAAVRFRSESALWIATRSSVALVQLGDNSRAELRCPCQPTGFMELAGGSTFRLTELSRAPVWVLHESEEGPRLIFIPPPYVPEPAEVASQ